MNSSSTMSCYTSKSFPISADEWSPWIENRCTKRAKQSSVVETAADDNKRAVPHRNVKNTDKTTTLFHLHTRQVTQSAQHCNFRSKTLCFAMHDTYSTVKWLRLITVAVIMHNWHGSTPDDHDCATNIQTCHGKRTRRHNNRNYPTKKHRQCHFITRLHWATDKPAQLLIAVHCTMMICWNKYNGNPLWLLRTMTIIPTPWREEKYTSDRLPWTI